MNKLRIDAERVKALMKLKSMTTMQDLAAASKVHPNTLTVVMRGGGWSAQTAERLAEALDCNPIDLLVTDGYRSPFSDAPATTKIPA